MTTPPKLDTTFSKSNENLKNPSNLSPQQPTSIEISPQFFSQSFLLEFLRKSIILYSISATITCICFPSSYLNLTIVLLLGFFCGYFINSKNSKKLDYQSIWFLLVFFYAGSYFAQSHFSIYQDNSRALTGFSFVVYSTIYAPNPNYKILLSSILFLLFSASTANLIVPVVKSTDSILLFIHICFNILCQVLVAIIYLSHVDPVYQKITNTLADITNEIDTILLHLLPPHIASSLSHHKFGMNPFRIRVFQKFLLLFGFEISSPLDVKSLSPPVIRAIDSFLEKNSDFNPNIPSTQLVNNIQEPNNDNPRNPITDIYIDDTPLESPSHSPPMNKLNIDSDAESRIFQVETPETPILSNTNSNLNPCIKLFPNHRSLSFIERFSLFFLTPASKNRFVKTVIPNNITVMFSILPRNKPHLSTEDIPLLSWLFELWDVQILEFSNTRVDKIDICEGSHLLCSFPDCPDPLLAIEFSHILINSFLISLPRFHSDLELRVGMAIGPVIAGVWGHTRFQYGIIGSSVELAKQLSFSPQFRASHQQSTAPSPPSTSSEEYVSISSTREPSRVSISPLSSGEVRYIDGPTPRSDSMSKSESFPLDSPPSQPNPSSHNKNINVVFIISTECLSQCSQPVPGTDINLSIMPNDAQIPAFQIDINQNLQSQQLFQHLSDTSSSSRHTPIRVPFKMQLNSISNFFLVIGVSFFFSAFLFLAGNVSKVFDVYFIIPLFCCFLCLSVWSILSHRLKTVESNILNSKSLFHSLFRLHANFFLIGVIAVVIAITFLIATSGNEHPGGPAIITAASLTLLILVDPYLFQKERNIFKIIMSFSTLVLIILGTFYTPPTPQPIQPPILGVLSNRDLNVLILGILHTLIFISKIHYISLHSLYLKNLKSQTFDPSIQSAVFPTNSSTINETVDDSVVNDSVTDSDSNRNSLQSFDSSSIYSIPSVFGPSIVICFKFSNFNSFLTTHLPKKSVLFLDVLFSKLDHLVSKFNFIKSPTIGSSYTVLAYEPGICSQIEFVKRKALASILFCEAAIELAQQLAQTSSDFRTSQLTLQGGISFTNCSGSAFGHLRPSFQYFGPGIEYSHSLSELALSNQVLVHPSLLQVIDNNTIEKFCCFRSNGTQ